DGHGPCLVHLDSDTECERFIARLTTTGTSLRISSGVAGLRGPGGIGRGLRVLATERETEPDHAHDQNHRSNAGDPEVPAGVPGFLRAGIPIRPRLTGGVGRAVSSSAIGA